jgi:hypothetical protein
MSLRLIQQLSIPQIDYSKLIVYTSNAPLISNVAKVYPNAPYQILNLQNDMGCLARAIAIELNGTLRYVNDYRHSHDSDTEDTTQFSTGNTSETQVLVIDYGSVINAKELVIKLGYWTGSSGYTAYVKVYISTDGTTWDQIAYLTTTSTSEVISILKLQNVSFRYLRFTLWIYSVTTAQLRVRKIFIVV